MTGHEDIYRREVYEKIMETYRSTKFSPIKRLAESVLNGGMTPERALQFLERYIAVLDKEVVDG